MSMTSSVEPSAPSARPTPPAIRRRGWTAGRIVSVVAGCMIGLLSLTLLSFGGLATWETNTDREAGFLTASAHSVTTGGYAITSTEFGELAGRVYGGLLGDVRIRATTTDGSPVFIGVAPTTATDQYLADVDHAVVKGWFPFESGQVRGSGAAPTVAPTDAKIWTAHASGTGTQTLTWRPAGDTTVVVMHPDAATGVTVTADIGASVPDLVWVAVALFVVGGVLLVAAIFLVAVPVTGVSKERGGS